MSEVIEETIKESDVLNGVQLTVTLSDGTVVTIKKCKVKQTGEVLRFISYLMKQIGMKNLTDTPNIDLNDPSELMLFMADSAENTYPMIAALSSLSVEEFEDLEIDDAMDVIMAMWNVNKNFFLRKILPMLGAPTPAKSPTSKVSRKKRSTPRRKAT